MSGGSFDYLYGADDPVSKQDAWEAMRNELVQLGADDIVAKMDAITNALAQLGSTRAEPGSVRDVWHAVERWRSGDCGFAQVEAALARFRAKHPRMAEREGEFARADSVAPTEITPRMVACLRGEHEDSGAWVSANGRVLFAPMAGSSSHGLHIRVCVCCHCRACFVPKDRP